MVSDTMHAPSLDVSAVIAAPAGRIMKAFFDADALSAWWQVRHSVTTPRTLGPYAIEWAPTDFRDEVLGRLGGVFRGTVMEFRAGEKIEWDAKRLKVTNLREANQYVTKKYRKGWKV